MTTAGFVVLALAVLANWAGLLVVSAHFLRANNRLMKSNDDLTSQVIAFKNPMAAQLYGQMQAAQAAQRYERAPDPLARVEGSEDDLLS